MILENCADYVKPGGMLVYGTCTLFKEENRGVIERLLSKRDDYERPEKGLEVMLKITEKKDNNYKAELIKFSTD